MSLANSPLDGHYGDLTAYIQLAIDLFDVLAGAEFVFLPTTIRVPHVFAKRVR